jgi:hypothetical protein
MLSSYIVRSPSDSSYTHSDIFSRYPQLEGIGDADYDATFRLLRDLKYLTEVEISHCLFGEMAVNESWLDRGIESLTKVLLASSADDKEKIIKVRYFCEQKDVSRVSALRLEKMESDSLGIMYGRIILLTDTCTFEPEEVGHSLDGSLIRLLHSGIHSGLWLVVSCSREEFPLPKGSGFAHDVRSASG